MKKLDIKSLIIGAILGTTGVSTVFAAGEIKSTKINSSKVYFCGNEINLKNPLIEVVKSGDSEAQLYMPMKDVLEYMQFKVDWNDKSNSVNLTMNNCNNRCNSSFKNGCSNGNKNNNINTKVSPNISKNEADSKAVEIIQKTGNWSYVESYLPYMSPEGIKKVVEIYNSKHMNPSEHKKASDYIKN